MKAQKQKGLFLGANHRFLGYNVVNTLCKLKTIEM